MKVTTLFTSIIAALVAAVLLAGCAPSGPAPLTDADRAAIEATTAAFMKAMQEANWEAAAATYAEDAILLPPNHDAVTGRAAIKEYFGTFPPISNFTVANTEVQGAGDMVVVRGTYSMTLTIPGMPPMDDHGKFVDVRKRQADGTWLFQWDMFNTSVPLPGMGH